MCLPFMHKWKVIGLKEVKRYSNLTNYVIGIWHVFTLQCEKCGNVKRKRVNHT